MDFADLGLSPETLKAVTDAGYLTPTPIQEQAIPVVLMGRDVLGVAQTGTGKTAAFTMPMIDILAGGRSKARMPRSLIIAPTRELAAQISDNFVKYGKYHPLSMALLIGGESMSDQEKSLDRGVDVLIATPGRLLDHFERGRILLNDVKVLVIDEADRMLDMGFIPDVERIASLLPKIRQTLFFSATMDKEIKKLADKFLMNPKEIAASPPATTASTIEQGLVMVKTLDKREALRRILRAKNIHNAFIFCNRKKDVDILYKSLTKHGFNAVALHGDMPQSKRNEMLAKFKAGEAELLVCSDVAARGLDISAVGHVINFDVPVNAEDYVHRIGRTGRAGLTGHAYTLATPGDDKLLSAVTKMIKNPIPPLVLPELEGIAVGAAASDEGDTRRGRGRGGDRGKERGGRESGGRGGRGRGRESGRESGRGRSERDAAPTVLPVEAAVEHPPEAAVAIAPEQPIAAFVAHDADRYSAPAESVAAAEAVSAEADDSQTDEYRPKRERGRKPERFDRNRDIRGPEDRAKKTRRNPHGIAEMEYGDNVLAFGGYTPEFMLVDPYNGKGAPSTREIDEAAESDEEFDAPVTQSDPTQSSSDDASSHTPEPDALPAAAGSESSHDDGAL